MENNTTGYKRKHMKSLDGIRGMAFLFVLFSHLSFTYGLIFYGIGKIGVWLFFILSSFLLSSYFIDEPWKTLNPLEWVNYAIRRLLRIYPLYFISLICYYNINFSRIKAHLLLQVGSGHFWTIPVEMTFYACLPFLLLIFINVLNGSLPLITMAVLAGIMIHQYYMPYYETVPGSIELVTFLPVFLLGILTAFWHKELSSREINPKIAISCEFIAGVTLLLSFLAMPQILSRFIGPINMDHYQLLFIWFGLAWSIFVLCVLNGTGYIRGVFESKPLRFLGNISLSGYLMHWLIINILANILNTYVAIEVFFIVAAIILLSWVFYRYFERPLMKINLGKYLNSNPNQYNKKTNDNVQPTNISASPRN